MKQLIITLSILLSLITSQLIAINNDNVNISGSYLGIFNSLSPTDQRTQFDFATNINVELTLAKNMTGIIQLQSGAGNGSLGFVGPSAQLTDINIQYMHPQSNSAVTIGSFDLPFGKGVNYLSNNGNTFQSPFILNSLTYSALAGPIGTLNTLGIKLKNTISAFETTLALSNGTGEDANNSQKNFLYLASLGTSQLSDKLYVGATYTTSEDSQDSSNSSYQTNFSGWLVDLNIELTPQLSFKNHIGQLTYNDNNNTTKDDVSIAKSEIKYTIAPLFISGRYSHWQPLDSNGNSTGISADAINPGLSLATITDTSITRWQLGIGYEVNKNTIARADVIMDDYQHGSDYKGIIIGLNSRF